MSTFDSFLSLFMRGVIEVFFYSSNARSDAANHPRGGGASQTYGDLLASGPSKLFSPFPWDPAFPENSMMTSSLFPARPVGVFLFNPPLFTLAKIRCVFFFSLFSSVLGCKWGFGWSRRSDCLVFSCRSCAHPRLMFFFPMTLAHHEVEGRGFSSFPFSVKFQLLL